MRLKILSVVVLILVLFLAGCNVDKTPAAASQDVPSETAVKNASPPVLDKELPPTDLAPLPPKISPDDPALVSSGFSRDDCREWCEVTADEQKKHYCKAGNEFVMGCPSGTACAVIEERARCVKDSCNPRCDGDVMINCDEEGNEVRDSCSEDYRCLEHNSNVWCEAKCMPGCFDNTVRECGPGGEESFIDCAPDEICVMEGWDAFCEKKHCKPFCDEGGAVAVNCNEAAEEVREECHPDKTCMPEGDAVMCKTACYPHCEMNIVVNCDEQGNEVRSDCPGTDVCKMFDSKPVCDPYD